ncbi:MAG: hypothetical protein FJX47_15265, partial [Alphaproteobacteria bacterium]|nr:hypothetical protein [Alphaproteobacteria bacterium]
MIRHPARRRPEDREPEWQARLNAFFSGHCEVVWFGTAAPDLVAVGPYQPEAEIAEAAAFERARLAEAGKPNEPHAVRDGVVDLTGEAPRIAYRVTDYGTVRALRRLRQGRNTGILSASSLPALASGATIYV